MKVATPPYSRPLASSSFVIPIASMDIVQAIIWTSRSLATAISSSSDAIPLSFIIAQSLLETATISFTQTRTREGSLFAFAMACILGGAIGNLVDRIAYGHVVDFLQFHYAGWYFPSFNVADSAITIGAGTLILDEVLRVRRAR